MGDSYDDYEGQVRCFVCRAILEIKAEGGQLKTVRFPNVAGQSPIRDVLISEQPPAEGPAEKGRGVGESA